MNDTKLVLGECFVCERRPHPRMPLWEFRKKTGMEPEKFRCEVCSQKGYASKQARETAIHEELTAAGYERCRCGEWCHRGTCDLDGEFGLFDGS